MMWYLAVFVVWAHTLWWGVGLARLLTPRVWAKWWPVFVPVVGFTLQTGVVWVGAWADLPGTNAYAWPAQIVPAGLAAWAWRRHGFGGAAWRRTAAWWGVTVVVLFAAARPLAEASPGLTSLSLGSCDHADYAAGARLMQEFARTDRSGFIGLVEVVELHGVTDLFRHFLRLNHFAPSAIVALTASVTGWAPWQLINVVTVVFLAGAVPLVAWLARTMVGLRGGVSAVVALAYGLNPLTWYAIAHGAMSQLLAAQAIALLTVVGVARARCLASGRRSGGGGLGLMGVAGALIWSAYHFIVLVAWMPAVAFAMGLVCRRRRVAWTARWAATLVVPVAGAGVFYLDRVLGLADRLRLFEEHDYGWKIPGTGPVEWVGWVAGPSLAPFDGALRWAALALLVGAGVVAARRWWGTDRGWAALALVGPAMIGYVFLLWRGAHLGTNASYDAYKLLSVFFPGVLAVTLMGIDAGKTFAARVVAGALAVLAGLGLARSVEDFGAALRAAPLRVSRDLVALQRLEAREDIASINVLPEAMWDRLWANVFLLRKPQYFAVYTYEGRRNTALRGEWDLRDGLMQVVEEPVSPETPRSRFVVEPHARAEMLRLEATGDWFAAEVDPLTDARWRWTGAEPGLDFVNTSGRARRGYLRIELRALRSGRAGLQQDGETVASIDYGVDRSWVQTDWLELPPGRTEWRWTGIEAKAPDDRDGRRLGWCVYRLELVLEP